MSANSIAEKFEVIADRVYEAGAKSEYDKFWDAYQANGNRIDYYMAFVNRGGQYWTLENFRPKYDIRPIYAQYLFYSFSRVDIWEGLKNAGVTIDLSRANETSNVFNGASATTRLPDMKFNSTNYSQCFNGCTNLHTIDKLYIKENAILTNIFQNCTSLANVVFDGVISRSLDTSMCPLTKESITSLTEHLKADITGQTVTFKKTAINEAFGVNVDDASTYTEEFNEWRNGRSNWTFSYV